MIFTSFIFWWFILGFISNIFVCKMMEGKVTIKYLIFSLFLSFIGYISSVVLLVLIMSKINDNKWFDKKLF